MKKRFVLLTMLLMMFCISAWADEPYTEFKYNGIVVIDGLKFAVTLPEEGKGEALLLGVDDTYSEARTTTRGIIAVQNLLKAYMEFKEKDVKRVSGGSAYTLPPPYGIFVRTRGLSADTDYKPLRQKAVTVDPDKQYTCELKVIGYSALQNNKDITELAIPETVTTIWGSAFDGCSNLQKVTLPSKLLSLGFRAFADCNSLTEISIPESVIEVQPGAFMNCKGLKKVSLPSGLTEISKYLFHHCENLQSVTGGEKATKIGNNAFECCYKLTDYTLPSALDSICDNAFIYCQQLTSITVPRTLRGFGVSAFAGCTRLKEVKFESGSTLKAINDEVFESTSITSVDIPESVERLGYMAFAYSDLESVTLPASLAEVGDSAFHETKLTSVAIPDAVTAINIGAFDCCRDMKSLTFGAGSKLKTIGDNAFYATGIASLALPDGVTSIGTGAFEVCYNLESVTLSKSLTSMGEDVFEYSLKSITAPMTKPFDLNGSPFSQDTYSSATLYIPKGTKQLYQAAEGWKDFVNMVEMDGEAVPVEGEQEPYVVYNDGTLTFYCDSKRNSRQGTVYDLENGNNEPGWLDKKESITKAIFDPSFANAKPKTTISWFYDCSAMTEIEGIVYLNTSNVTSMMWMFSGCSGLTHLDVSKFNTNNVTNMSAMFQDCRGLTSLDVSNFNTSNVTNMTAMFLGCSGLTSLDVSNFNISNVTNISAMFSACSGLTSLDVSMFNTVNVTQIRSMFYECINLSKLTLGNSFTTSGELECSYVFTNCNSLKTVAFTGDIPSSINSKFFEGAGTADAPATLDVPEQYRDHYAAKFNGKMFYGGYFTLSGDNPSVGDAEPYVVYNNGTLSFYCDGQRSSHEGMTYDLNEGEDAPGWYENRNSITKVLFDPSFAAARPTSGHEWFDGCTQLTEIDGIENLNTSEMTIMAEMFFSCRHLNNVDLSHFNTSKVTDMRAMFSGCSGLKSIDLRHFDTSNTNSFGALVYGCSSITEINLSNFDTSKATQFSNLFTNCTSLKEILFGNSFEISEGAIVNNVFKGCTNLKTIRFMGDIPSSVNSNFFQGVGTEETPAALIVPKQYKSNFDERFDGKAFCGGYFTLKGAIEGDVNGDGEVTEEDKMEVKALILDSNMSYYPTKDINHDGFVNVADIVEMVNIMKESPDSGSGYFWLGTYFPKSNTFPEMNGEEVAGIVTTYTSLDDAIAKASRTYSANEYAVVLYPSSWGTKEGLVFYDATNKKYYEIKKNDVSDFPDYTYYESKLKIGADTTITLSTEAVAKAAGATLYSPPVVGQ